MRINKKYFLLIVICTLSVILYMVKQNNKPSEIFGTENYDYDKSLLDILLPDVLRTYLQMEHPEIYDSYIASREKCYLKRIPLPQYETSLLKSMIRKYDFFHEGINFENYNNNASPTVKFIIEINGNPYRFVMYNGEISPGIFCSFSLTNIKLDSVDNYSSQIRMPMK